MQDPIYDRIENTPRPTLFAASGFVWLAALGLWLSELAVMLLRGLFPMGEALEGALYYLPFVLLPVALYMGRRTGLADGMRLKPLPFAPTLLVAMLAIFSVTAASVLTAAWGLGLDALGLHQMDGYAVPQGQQALALSILTQAVMPAVCEELLFRGFVLSAWESRGTRYAIGVSAALFALLHGNLYGLPAYLLVGAIAGFVTFALDSVYAGMVYHTVYNAACLVVSWLVASAGEAAETATATGTFPVISLVLETAMVYLMMAMLLVMLRLRAQRHGIQPIPRVRRPLETRDKVMLIGATATMLASTVVLLALSGMK